MSDTVLFGRGRDLIRIPRVEWEGHLAQVPVHQAERLNFMTPDHHRLRYFVARELPRFKRAIAPIEIAQALSLPLEQVNAILEELENKLFFLVRDSNGNVAWAFPVTIEPTPHRLTFDSGEKLYAAWAEDTLAAPFVQGRLINKPLSVSIKTECAHCSRPIDFTLDQDLHYQLTDPSAVPLVFEPQVDWPNFKEPNIIHAYWNHSTFFWSEEHAREYRLQADRVNGLYLTLDQSAYSTPIVQGALFAF
jgi:alkylmercury lyase-like protein